MENEEILRHVDHTLLRQTATREDIRLFAAHIGKDVKMKAAGGIRSLKDAEDFLALGCRRLGTSAVVRLVKEGAKN